jgi:hypothetical protein
MASASTVTIGYLGESMALHIGKVLAFTNGKVNGPGGAAQLLGIYPSTLRSRMESRYFHPFADRRRIVSLFNSFREVQLSF